MECQPDAAARAFALPREKVADLFYTGLADAYFTDRYPSFDLDDPDWPKLREQLRLIDELLAKVKVRLPAEKPPTGA